MFSFSNVASRALSRRPRPSFMRSMEERLGVTFLVLAILVATVFPAPAHDFKAGDLHIDHPWSRETPAAARVAGGFLVIHNSGGADRLVSVSSDISDRSEIHEMAVRDGVMTMRPLADGLEIPAGGTVELAPGGYHLMFIGLTRQPRQGESFTAELVFEKAGTVAVEFTVEAMGGGQGGHAGQGTHGG